MSGFIPLFANAKHIIPGIINKKTGVSFKKPAKMVPRLACLSSRAPRILWTIYWSVHQYHKQMIGAHNNMAGHGYLSLKSHACLPASFKGAHVPSPPAG